MSGISSLLKAYRQEREAPEEITVTDQPSGIGALLQSARKGKLPPTEVVDLPPPAPVPKLETDQVEFTYPETEVVNLKPTAPVSDGVMDYGDARFPNRSIMREDFVDAQGGVSERMKRNEDFGNLEKLPAFPDEGSQMPEIAFDQDGFPINLERKLIQNDDGTKSTEESVTVRGDQIGYAPGSRMGLRWFNIPTIYDGIRYDPEQATIQAQNVLNTEQWQFPNYFAEEQALSAAPQRSEVIRQWRDPDRSFGAAMKHGAYTAIANARNFTADLFESIRTRRAQGDEKIYDEDLQKIRKSADELERFARQTGFRHMSTEEIESFRDFLTYVESTLGSTTPYTISAMMSAGVLSPYLMAADLNAELSEIENLPLDERLAYASVGGAIAGTLENLGLAVAVRGVPREILGKMGIPGLIKHLEARNGKELAVQMGEAVMTGAVAEGLTEFGQEGTNIVAKAFAGGDFGDGEIGTRLKEATLAGVVSGTAFGGPRAGAKATQYVAPMIQNELESRRDMQEGREFLEQEALREATLGLTPNVPSFLEKSGEGVAGEPTITRREAPKPDERVYGINRDLRDPTLDIREDGTVPLPWNANDMFNNLGGIGIRQMDKTFGDLGMVKTEEETNSASGAVTQVWMKNYEYEGEPLKIEFERIDRRNDEKKFSLVSEYKGRLKNIEVVQQDIAEEMIEDLNAGEDPELVLGLADGDKVKKVEPTDRFGNTVESLKAPPKKPERLTKLDPPKKPKAPKRKTKLKEPDLPPGDESTTPAFLKPSEPPGEIDDIAESETIKEDDQLTGTSEDYKTQSGSSKITKILKDYEFDYNPGRDSYEVTKQMVGATNTWRLRYNVKYNRWRLTHESKSKIGGKDHVINEFFISPKKSVDTLEFSQLTPEVLDDFLDGYKLKYWPRTDQTWEGSDYDINRKLTHENAKLFAERIYANPKNRKALIAAAKKYKISVKDAQEISDFIFSDVPKNANAKTVYKNNLDIILEGRPGVMKKLKITMPKKDPAKKQTKTEKYKEVKNQFAEAGYTDILTGTKFRDENKSVLRKIRREYGLNFVAAYKHPDSDLFKIGKFRDPQTKNEEYYILGANNQIYGDAFALTPEQAIEEIQALQPQVDKPKPQKKGEEGRTYLPKKPTDAGEDYVSEDGKTQQQAIDFFKDAGFTYKEKAKGQKIQYHNHTIFSKKFMGPNGIQYEFVVNRFDGQPSRSYDPKKNQWYEKPKRRQTEVSLFIDGVPTDLVYNKRLKKKMAYNATFFFDDQDGDAVKHINETGKELIEQGDPNFRKKRGSKTKQQDIITAREDDNVGTGSRKPRGGREGERLQSEKQLNRQSTYRSLYRDLGLKLSVAESMAPIQLRRLAVKHMKKKFGLKYIAFSKNKGKDTPKQIETDLANLLNSYQNLQVMANVLGLPATALSLDGKLGLALPSKTAGNYYAAFYGADNVMVPSEGKGGHKADLPPIEAPFIIMPKQSTSFAHEQRWVIIIMLSKK